MNYCFESTYYIKDIQATFNSVFNNLNIGCQANILPNKDSIVELPFGEGSNLLDPHNLLEPTYTKLSKYEQIKVLEASYKPYDELADINVKHKKVSYAAYERLYPRGDIRNSLITNEIFPDIGYTEGNEYNTNIQLFNKSSNKSEFIKAALLEYNKTSENLSKAYIGKSNDEFTETIGKIYDKLQHNKIKINILSLSKDYKNELDDKPLEFLKLALTKIRRSSDWMKFTNKSPNISLKRTKERGIIFFEKLLLYMYNNIDKNKEDTYQIPSVFLKKLDANYCKFFTILKKSLNITMIIDYYNGTLFYKCRTYDLTALISNFINKKPSTNLKEVSGLNGVVTNSPILLSLEDQISDEERFTPTFCKYLIRKLNNKYPGYSYNNLTKEKLIARFSNRLITS